MPADHRGETRRFGIKIKRVRIVKNVDVESAQLHYFRLCKTPGPRLRIHIAADGRYWRNLPQLRNNLRCADVPGMKNVLRSTQQLNRFRTKQPMRIGNHSNNHLRLSALISGEWNSELSFLCGSLRPLR